MPSTFLKALVATLAFGVVHGFPQFRAPSPRADSATPSPHSTDEGLSDNTKLIAELITEPTVIKRFQRLLTVAGQQLISGVELAKTIVYDFKKGGIPVPGSQGGTATSSNVETFPILLGSGITMNFGVLGPCGVFLPHVHPRANEYFVVVDGEVDFGYMLEIGLLKTQAPNPQIGGKLTKYTGTLFPQGSIHYQVNNSPDCKPATVLASFNSEDPGSTLVLQAPSGGNATVIPRQVDGQDFDKVRAQLPPQIVSVVDQCLSRCNTAKA